ncbi:MAG: OmpA family protein [Alcaligenaceae bacterium]|jgi:outer membrane protein OmpA-like peptidoglycan-associated protein|nr:OmpA family protein [Alcaligenaceae bacterium]
MRNIISYPIALKVSRLSAISSIILLSACTTLGGTNQEGKGSLRVDQDGQPTTDKRIAWVTDNWQELNNAIKSANTTALPIEVNQVHDGSLRLLIPASEIFSGNSLRINRKSHIILDKLVEEMNMRQELRVRIVGHTDSSGDDIQNQILSLNRSNSVARYLIAQGLRSSRIELEGRGSIDPLVSNDSRQNRLINRRIELYLYRLR